MVELNLTMRDKAVLESPNGMLTDKHMDAASKLLSTQFPHMQGLQSSLRYQTAGGLTPITFSGGFVPEGLSQTVKLSACNCQSHDNYALKLLSKSA